MTFWVAGAVVGSAVIGGMASGNAADAQLQGSRENAAVQREMFNKNVELQAPFREGGLKAQNQLLDLLGISGNTNAEGYGSLAKPFSGQDMYKDPGYAFRLNEGVKALDRSAAARGGLLGGNQMRGVTEFGQNYASGEYQNAFNRYQAERAARLNPLQSLLGQGQSTSAALGNAATNLGGQLGANAVDTGNIRASGYMGTANALSGALGSGVNYYTNQQAQTRQQQNFDRMMGLYGGGGDNMAAFTNQAYPR
jgi:hypothetical protein